MSAPDDDRRARWGHWREFRTAPKKPPPAHGLKIKKAGTTWWGQRWIEALEHVLEGDAGRLGRGRSYARAGRVHDLHVERGQVLARVTGSRPKPYQVTIGLAQLSASDWKRAITALAERAQFLAELLSGEMPKAIDEAFQAAGSRLFPETRAELETECNCPDWGNPCKHVAATHYVLGEALDRDPFLLFELRGRSKERVLDALRRARGGGAASEAAPLPAPGTSIDLAAYDRAPGALPALAFSFDAPASHAAVLRQLGAPSAWSEEASPADALAPLVQRAAEAARRIALAEPEPAPAREAPASEPAPSSEPAPRVFRPRTAKKRTKKAARRPAKR
ncbi:MAG TPA: SWIM zinc finger family protein [Polyangiaceae bacterium]|nr:SWIM zinc finger family protein [Polyangiaceae bacterium]